MLPRLAQKNCERHALGFRSEEATATTLHAFWRTCRRFLYNFNYFFEKGCKRSITRLEIQSMFPLLDNKKVDACNLREIAGTDMLRFRNAFGQEYSARLGANSLLLFVVFKELINLPTTERQRPEYVNKWIDNDTIYFFVFQCPVSVD
jgi:hypothetical protein